MPNDIIQKGQITALFFKNFFRIENLKTAYTKNKARQDMLTWAFIIGSLTTHFFGLWTMPVFVTIDVLYAFWIGMKLNGLWENPEAAL